MPATGTQPPIIGALLTEANVLLGVDASDKTTLIRSLIEALVTGPDEDLEQVASAVFARETLLSTGVGYGVALPHAKTGGIDETRAIFAVLATPVEFDAFDGEPVTLVFLLVGPTRSARTHIQTLGRISRILDEENTRAQLLNAKTPLEVVAVFESAEAKLVSD
jgi:mannitol/fructose-specific phosphotransferase system IIA component (Ntr-type)